MPPDEMRFSSVLMGRLLLVLGVAGSLLLLAAQFEDVPANWLRLMRQNSAMWLLVSGTLVVTGIRLLWQAGHQRTVWKPVRPGQRFHTVLVYSRPECLLCEEAVEVLNQYRHWIPIPSEVNITEDPELLERYRESIPVIVIDGRKRFQGNVNEVLLRRLIEGTPPLPDLRIL